MIKQDHIKALLTDIENERVERTAATRDTDKFARAVCAFANDLPGKGKPGYLLVGANDDGSLCGLKVTDELLRNLAALRSDGNILPQPALMVEKVSFPEGDVAVVEVQPSKITPVKYKGVPCIRIGARRGEANEEELRILRERSEVKSPTFDTTPCLHSTMDDLDLELFQTEYLPKFVKAGVLKSDRRPIKQQLASLQLFDLTHDCPTVAGVLLVGKNPKQILFGAYIQYVQFAGRNRAARVVNERQFSGNLLTMLKELDYFIKYTIQKQRPVFVTVLREEMRINYPYEAIRELAMNLVMHRNYQTNAPARMYEYSDRIEMDNPGNLYGRVRPDNFPNENDYRNPVIAVAMKTLGYVNQFGRGIEMVQEELEANKNGAADFKFDDITTFKAVIMNADPDAEYEAENVAEKQRISDVEGGVGADGAENGAEVGAENTTIREQKILALIEQNSNVSRGDIAKKLNVGTTTVYRDINALKEKGILERVGGDRGGHWKIKR